jgi:hypothetical protein
MTHMENGQRSESRGTACQDPESKHASVKSAELFDVDKPEGGPAGNGSTPLPHFDAPVDGGIQGWTTVAGS